jgi:hypothetical protein
MNAYTAYVKFARANLMLAVALSSFPSLFNHIINPFSTSLPRHYVNKNQKAYITYYLQYVHKNNT